MTKLLKHELGSIYCLTQVQKKNFGILVRVADCYAGNLGLIPVQVHIFEKFLVNSCD